MHRRRTDPITPIASTERMMAVDGPNLTKAQIAETVQRLKERQASDDGLSNKAVGTAIGCSAATISQIRNGNYTGDLQKWAKLLRNWLASMDGRAEMITPDVSYVDTSVGTKILSMCTLAVGMPTMVGVMTETGCGKTAALKEAVRRRGGMAVYVQAGIMCSTPKQLLHAICRAMGLAATYPQDKSFELVRQRLAAVCNGDKGVPFLIVVDEATTLQARTLSMLRNLHDDPGCRAAIVLGDTIARLDRVLYSSRKEHVEVGGVEQLRRRMKVYNMRNAREHFSTATGRADVHAVAEAEIRSLGHKTALRKETLSYLVKLARRPGSLGNVVDRLRAVSVLAAKTGSKATFSVAELDYVGELFGEQSEIEMDGSPFVPERQPGTGNLQQEDAA